MKISEHISYLEATKSATAIKKGIDNTPDEVALESMKLVATKVYEPVRVHFNKLIGLSSFFRSPKLNKIVGGSTSSQHVKGEAMDIDTDIFGGLTNSEVFNYIWDNLDFDQLIWEFGDDENPDWVHVSYKASNNRGQVLRTSRNSEGKTITTVLQ